MGSRKCRVLLAAAVISVLAVTGARADAEPAAVASASAKAVAGADRATTDAVAEPRRGRKKRPGCRRFCQQAGGFGDGGSNAPVQMPEQTLRGTRDRIVSVRSTCVIAEDCVGAIILSNFKFEYGRANFEVPAGETRKVPVGISRRAKEWLGKHGPDKKAFATVPLVDREQPVSVSEDLTVVRP